MRILPAVDIYGGRVVRLRGGDPSAPTFDAPDPMGVARAWARRGARGLHVVDLDAAFGRGENRALVRSILKTLHIPIQVGGGVRDLPVLEDLLAAGAHRVVVGTRAWKDPAFLREVTSRHPGRVAVAIETRRGRLAVSGWTETLDAGVDEALGRIDGLPLGAVLATCIDVEGQMRGPDVGMLRALVERLEVPVIASGGVRNTDDVAAVRDAGCAAVVVGTAFYAGALDLDKAQEVAGDGDQPDDA